MATDGSPADMEDMELQHGSNKSQTPSNVVNVATPSAHTIHVTVENDHAELLVMVTNMDAGDTSSLITNENRRVSKSYGAIRGVQPIPVSVPINKTSKVISNLLPPKGGCGRLEKARTISFSGVSDDDVSLAGDTKKGCLKKERTVSFSADVADDDDEEEDLKTPPPPESLVKDGAKSRGLSKGAVSFWPFAILTTSRASSNTKEFEDASRLPNNTWKKYVRELNSRRFIAS
jgi:hypothetical protein